MTILNGFNITELDNGVRIVTENIPYVKSFSLGFWFDVGSRDENEKNNGISHFLEHMLFKGTEKRSAKKISSEIESLGGYLNAFTSKEHTCFYGRGLSRHINKTFAVLADMVQYSIFRENEIERESGVIVDELYDIEDSPEELIFDKFESLVLNGNSLGMPIIGTENNIRNFTREDILRFIGANYGFDRTYIVVSGLVEHNKVVKLAQKYLTRDMGLAGKRVITDIPMTSGCLHVGKEIQQAHMIIGTTVPGYNHNDRIKITLLSHILGEGSSSRLFQTVREKNGVTYQINTFLNSFYDLSTFGVYFSTSEKLAEKVRALVYNEFRKIRKREVSQSELNRAKEYLKGSILMGLENTTNRMMRMAQSFIYFDRVKPVEESLKEINEVTPEDILEMANKYLDENIFSEIVISSKNIFMHSAA